MARLNHLLHGELLADREQEFYWLWIGATTAYGVGDIVTTVTILKFDVGVTEANLLLLHLFNSVGDAGLIGLKIAVFVFCILLSVVAVQFWDDVPLYYLPPGILMLVGSSVTFYNLSLMLR